MYLGKFSIQLTFLFFQLLELMCCFKKKKKEILFHFPHKKISRIKEGQRQGKGFTLTIWEAFTLDKDLETDKIRMICVSCQDT